MRKQGGQWKGSDGDIDCQAIDYACNSREDTVDTVRQTDRQTDSQSVTRNQKGTLLFPTRWREGRLGLDTGNAVYCVAIDRVRMAEGGERAEGIPNHAQTARRRPNIGGPNRCCRPYQCSRRCFP